MKKVLVITQNQQKAEDCEKLLPGVYLRKVYPGTKRFPRHFDAVIIYHIEQNEINFIKDEISRYNDAPIKAFFGKTKYEDAAFY